MAVGSAFKGFAHQIYMAISHILVSTSDLALLSRRKISL